MTQGDKLAEVSDLLFLNKRLLSVMGIWPKETNDVRFAFHFIYMFILVSMEWADFIDHIGNLEKILENLIENVIYTLLLIKIVLSRKNLILIKMIDAMYENCENLKINHKNSKGENIYATYNRMAKNFYKIVIPLVATTAILYYLRPLVGYLVTSSNNGTTPFALPYRTHFFYEITDVYSYAIAYAYLTMALHMVVIGWVGTDGLLISLTLHVCGQLALLADDIVSLKKATENSGSPGISNIVKRHRRLIWMAKNIDTEFTGVLFGQLVGCALLISLTGYSVVANSERTERTNLITFVLFEISMLILLYFYCFTSECLIQESQRVSDAFYQCAWYEMPTHQSKDLIICIAGSEKPLYLTAGKFYILSLENFTRVIKISFTYLSVLRTLV